MFSCCNDTCCCWLDKSRAKMQTTVVDDDWYPDQLHGLIRMDSVGGGGGGGDDDDDGLPPTTTVATTTTTTTSSDHHHHHYHHHQQTADIIISLSEQSRFGGKHLLHVTDYCGSVEDEGVASDMSCSASCSHGSQFVTPELLTPQMSVEPNPLILKHGFPVVSAHSSTDTDDDHHHQLINRSTERGQSQSTSGSVQSNGNVPDSNRGQSSYDWPMTTTEKLMPKYAYKNELAQFIERMDNAFPLLDSGRRETILQGLRVIYQIVDEVWKLENSLDMISGICCHLQKSSNLDFVVQLFITGQHDLRLEAGEVLEAYLSTGTCSYLLQGGYLRDLVRTLIVECDKKDEANTRLALSLLETFFRLGADTCLAVVEYGGLDYLLDVCKSQMRANTLVHAAVALANLSIFGDYEIHRIMVEKQVPAWSFLLLTYDDHLTNYYGCLCVSMIAASKAMEYAVQESGTLPYVAKFLKMQKPENVARLDVKYRQGRSMQWLKSLGRILHSSIAEVVALGCFQLAMEASLRRGSERIDVFDELRLTPRIQEIASVPGYDIASKFAAMVLSMIGEPIPYKLSQNVPYWSVKDVSYWVRKVGFQDYTEMFVKHRVDGDLLLRTSDEHLMNEIGMRSAYERMRFIRELTSLKRSADYSSIDRTRMDAWLMRLDPAYSVYSYHMLLGGIDRSALIHLTESMLENVCGINNQLHRLKLMHAIKEVKHVDDLDLALLRKQVDVFICYRRATGSQLASLLKVLLQLRGFKVFIDVDRLFAGQFDKSLLMNIRAAKHFIVVLTPRSLDPCLGDDECKDWVHLEIQTALESKAMILPVQEKGFEWPPVDQLPQDIQCICGYNSIQWVHEYQEACMEKLTAWMQTNER